MSYPNKQSTKILPFIAFDEVDVYNMYALQGYGVKGTFVKVASANIDNAIGIVGSAGALIDKTLSPQWGSTLTVVPCASGDLAAQILGITLKNVFQFDENGELMKYKKQKRIELDSVVSGEAVPILGRAPILTLGTGALLFSGYAPASAPTFPSIGDLAVAANGGLLNIVPAATFSGSHALILGSVIGQTSQFGSGVVINFRA